MLKLLKDFAAPGVPGCDAKNILYLSVVVFCLHRIPNIQLSMCFYSCVISALIRLFFATTYRATGAACGAMRATHVAVCLDAAGRNFRHDIDPTYKAHRPGQIDRKI